MVDGVVYTNDELKDLLGRGLPAADLREVHLVKQEFEGTVIPSKQATKIKSHPTTRWWTEDLNG